MLRVNKVGGGSDQQPDRKKSVVNRQDNDQPNVNICIETTNKTSTSTVQ